MMVDSSFIESLKLNHSSEFSAIDFVFKQEVNQIKNYCIINTDSVDHEIQFKNSNTANIYILSNDTVDFSLEYLSEGLFMYEDQTNYPFNSHLGLSGMIYIGDAVGQTFYWNLKEHDTNWVQHTINSTTSNVDDYQPSYFTINSYSNPIPETDSTTIVHGQVGDELLINIYNSGRMNHALHFHGYHVEILHSSAKPNHVGRLKDSFNIKPSEGVIVKLVPDKPGVYPVHDHNLGATLGNGTYANGMLTLLKITE